MDPEILVQSTILWAHQMQQIGTPWEPPIEPPYGPPATDQWAAGAGTEQKPFDSRDWSTDGKKASKELKTFDGDLALYDNWRRRIRDHFVATNCNYATIFKIVESQKIPIRWSDLRCTMIEELPHT